MKKAIVFDIETTSVGFDNLVPEQQEYIIRSAKTEEEKERKKDEMALAPLTSRVVCIGLQLMEKDENGVWQYIKKISLSLDPDLNDDEDRAEIDLADGSKCLLMSEQKLLQSFWQILSKYSDASLVSFNGRNFDAPFLMLRSALLRTKPSRNLMTGTRYNYPMHVDLIDELTFYNPSQYGATRRYNFDFYARAFGIKSPKSEGVDGSKVGELFAEKKFAEIAEYCLRDVSATWELYQVWEEYLAF